MNKFRRILCLILSLLIVLMLCGCGEDESSAIIYYGVTVPPKTIDPQKASTASEFLIVRNLFEGLMRENDNGELENGVITNYEKNGLTYIFHIKPDAVWADENETPLTANDFVFALRRALEPKTAALHAKSLYCIKNAEQINNGNFDSEKLGVSALDEKTLKIELSYEDSEFLTTLSTAICMPCNKEFFNKSIGKYGMSGDTVLANGSYKMRKWITTDFAMRIIKNQAYTGNFKAKNAAIYFSKNKDYTNLECLNKHYFDICSIDTSDVEPAKSKGFNVLSLNNKVIVLSLSKDFSKDMRKALFGCTVKPDDFKNNKHLEIAKTIYPDILKISDVSQLNLYNPTASKKLYASEYKRLELTEFPQTAIQYYGDENTLIVSKLVASQWQQHFGLYINVAKANSLEGLEYARDNEKNSITIYSIDINQTNPYEYLEKLNSKVTGTFDTTQTNIIEDYSNIPLAYASSYYAFSEKISNVTLHSANGAFDFSQIQKQD